LKSEEHRKHLIDSTKIMTYRSSEEYRTAIKFLGICHSDNFNVTVKVFTLLRNFLLFNINVRNINRAGVLSEMSVDDFNKRLKAHNREDGTVQYIITVYKHKTIATSDPAKLVLTPILNQHMELYANYFRPKVVQVANEVAFFTNYKGTSLGSSSGVSQSLKRHSNAAGIGNITSNDCRRSLYSYICN